MSLLPVPEDLEPLFSRPGRLWTEAERWRVKTWLQDRGNQLRLLLKATDFIGQIFEGASPYEAEDVWAALCGRLDQVIATYDPAKSPFDRYLIGVALRNDCRRRGEQLLYRAEQMEKARVSMVSQSDDPERGAAVRERDQRLRDCVKTLKSEDQALVKQRYYEDRSTEEIAQTLGVRENVVRQRLTRVRARLKICVGE